MSYTLEQLSTYYDAINVLVTQLATSTEISNLTTLLTAQHVATQALISALTVRIQSLEDWKIAHMAS